MRVEIDPIRTFIGLYVITYPLTKQFENTNDIEIQKAFTDDENLYFACNKKFIRQNMYENIGKQRVASYDKEDDSDPSSDTQSTTSNLPLDGSSNSDRYTMFDIFNNPWISSALSILLLTCMIN